MVLERKERKSELGVTYLLFFVVLTSWCHVIVVLGRCNEVRSEV